MFQTVDRSQPASVHTQNGVAATFARGRADGPSAKAVIDDAATPFSGLAIVTVGNIRRVRPLGARVTASLWKAL
jgi:hypothetical protein